MINAVLRRTLVDLWDNAVICFALNIVVLGLAAMILYPVSLSVGYSPLWLSPMLVITLWAKLYLYSASGGLIEQIAERSDIAFERMRPDVIFCLLLSFTLAGIFGLGILCLQDAGLTTPSSVAKGVAGLWLFIFGTQAAAFSPAFALDRHRTKKVRMAGLFTILVRFPVECLTIMTASLFSMAATVGLLPGPCGAAYFHLRSGRLLQIRLTAEDATFCEAILAERRPLLNRTPRNLLQPWRAQ